MKLLLSEKSKLSPATLSTTAMGCTCHLAGKWLKVKSLYKSKGKSVSSSIRLNIFTPELSFWLMAVQTGLLVLIGSSPVWAWLVWWFEYNVMYLKTFILLSIEKLIKCGFKITLHPSAIKFNHTIVAATKGDKQSPSDKPIVQNWRSMVPNVVRFTICHGMNGCQMCCMS